MGTNWYFYGYIKLVVFNLLTKYFPILCWAGYYWGPRAEEIKKLTVVCGAYMRHNRRGSWNWDWNDAYDDIEEENEGEKKPK